MLSNYKYQVKSLLVVTTKSRMVSNILIVSYMERIKITINLSPEHDGLSVTTLRSVASRSKSLFLNGLNDTAENGSIYGSVRRSCIIWST